MITPSLRGKMTYDHYTFWYFTTTQCPGLASQHLSIISWLRNYHFHSRIASLFTEAVFSRRQGSTMLCPQLVSIIHMSRLVPAKKPWCPSRLTRTSNSQPKPFHSSTVFCLLTPLLQHTALFNAFQRGWGSWKPHLLQMTYCLWHAEQTGSWEQKGKCLWKICFKWLRILNSHDENHTVNSVLGM